MIKTAIIGCGHWGRLLIRSLSQNPDVHLRYFCDLDPHRLAQLKTQHGYVNATTNAADVFSDVAVDAVVIATPMTSHFELAKAAILAGKHVLVEQPMATTVAQCTELMRLAEEAGVVLCVDHIDEYNTALAEMVKLARTGQLGDLRYIYAQRLNQGESSSSAGVVNELAAHELYTATNLLEMTPVSISAKGLRLLSSNVEDVAFVTCDFSNGVTLHIHASWLDPNKVRRMTVVGSESMVEYNDIRPDARLTIYNTRTDLDETSSPLDSFDQFQLRVRSGDVVIPRVRYDEPLQGLCKDFVHCVTEGAVPQSDALKARRVVTLLEAARQSIQADGTPVRLKEWC